MSNDVDPTVDELMADRLTELAEVGHITPSIYQAASSSRNIALGIMVGYLETCYERSGSPDA